MRATDSPVVVGVGERQPSVLRYAALEARRQRRPLRVVHSYGLPPQVADMYLGDPAIVEQLRAAGQTVLDDARQVVQDVDATLSAEYVLSARAPLETLQGEALQAYLLVLGADDVAWLDRLLRTRIAGHLAQHAPCPVVIVPDQELSTGPGVEVVVMVEGVTSAASTFGLAFEEADARDCPLHVLHATPPGTPAAAAATARAKVVEELARWRRRYPDLAVLEGNAPHAASVTAVRAIRSAALVIVARPRNRQLPMTFSRPLAIEVLKRAHCPVAIVPAGPAHP
ncbi:MAG: universal stress protein [Aeromicrobium sp.]